VGPDAVHGAGVRRGRFVLDGVGDLVAACGERVDLGTEFTEAGTGVRFVDGSALERGPVAVACGGLGGDGGFDGV
jgi:hypothetical protein